MFLWDLDGVSYCNFKKGDCIIKQGDTPEYVYKLVTGSFNRVMVNRKGDEMIMEKFHKGDLLCVVQVYSNIPSGSNIIASEDSTCCRISRSAFLEELDTNIELLKIVLNKTVKNYIKISWLHRLKQERRTPNSICSFVINHAQKNEDTLLLDKAYNNSEIARLLGVHRVTVARIINRLIHEGVLRRSTKGLLILNPDELLQYVNNEKGLSY